jgi:hypothetical protein
MVNLSYRFWASAKVVAKLQNASAKKKISCVIHVVMVL